MLPMDVQDDAESRRGDVPAFVGDYSGPAVIESYSIVYGREGQPSHGSVIGRTPDGARVFGKVDVADGAAMATLLSLSASPIGLPGRVTVGEDGLQLWDMT